MCDSTEAFTELLLLKIISHLFPQLNVYTPVQQAAQAQFVPEKPGVIESGLTAARESILPLAQAVKVQYTYIVLC